MVKFIIGNAFVKVEHPEGVEHLIRDALSYQVKGADVIIRRAPKGSRLKKWDGKNSFYDARKKVFMTGLIGKVLKHLDAHCVKYEAVDVRNRPEVLPTPGGFSLHGIELRDYQRKALKDIVKSGRGVAQLATGAGKTEIAIALTKGLRLPTLFLTHRVNLLAQTAKRFQLRCPELRDHIGVFGAGMFEPRLVTIATVQTLFAFIKKNLEGAAQFLEQFQVLIIDEAHRSGAKQFHVPAMMCKNAFFRVALTATPFMNGNAESDMYLMGITGGVIAKVSNGELIERGILARPFFKFFTVTEPDLSRGFKWRDAYERGIVFNVQRNAIIATQARKLSEKGHKILVIVNEVRHGELLEELIRDQHVRVKYVDGQNTMAEREKALNLISKDKIDCIITTNIFDEGIDVNDISVVILAAGNKSAPALFQRTGRAIRKKEEDNFAIIIDFIDKTNKYLFDHSMMRYDLVKHEDGFVIL